MKHRGLLLALFLCWAASARAQVEVEVLTDQNQFLPGETLPVRVRIHNFSGQTLHFGDEAWLSYSIESRDGSIVDKIGDPPVGHDFDVPTSKVATQPSDLAPYFRIAKSGRYFITATVKFKGWGAEATSKPKGFDVISGVKMWEQEFGVPDPGNRDQPEVRKYILQKATYLKNLRLYLRVTDATEANVIRVLSVGNVVSYSNPQTLLDSHNNLYLLYEEGARAFNYIVVNPDGDLLMRQTYMVSDTNPHLKLLEGGKVGVVGGYRLVAKTDFPPSREPAKSTPPPAAVPSTNNPAPTKKK